MLDHGHPSQLIVEISIEPERNQPLNPGVFLGLSVQWGRLGEQQCDPTGQLLLIVGRQFGEDVGEEGPLHHFEEELAIDRACRCVRV